MVKIEFVIGNQKLTFEGADMKSVHKFSSVYGMLPSVCDNCKGKNVFLSHKSPGGNDYFLIACKDCGAEQALHQKKEGGFFVKREDKMKKYEPQKDGEKDPKPRIQPADEESPF